MLQNAGVFNILTCKCASRHSGVQFFDIKPPKSGPYPSVFPHFDLKMCFAPQPRAILEHRNFQNGSRTEVFCTVWLENVLRATAKNGSDNEVFCAFWLANVLRATAACHFSPVCQNSYLRTRRFSEAARLLFEHQEPWIIEKTQRFATSLTFFARVPSF